MRRPAPSRCRHRDGATSTEIFAYSVRKAPALVRILQVYELQGSQLKFAAVNKSFKRAISASSLHVFQGLHPRERNSSSAGSQRDCSGRTLHRCRDLPSHSFGTSPAAHETFRAHMKSKQNNDLFSPKNERSRRALSSLGNRFRRCHNQPRSVRSPHSKFETCTERDLWRRFVPRSMFINKKTQLQYPALCWTVLRKNSPLFWIDVAHSRRKPSNSSHFSRYRSISIARIRPDL